MPLIDEERFFGRRQLLRDAESVLVMQWGALDLALMRRSARAADVVETLERLLQRVRREIEG
jgi:hypothetical protein